MSAVSARCELCVEPPCPPYGGPARLCHAGCCPVGCHAVVRGLVRKVLDSLGGSNSGCCHRWGKRQFGQPAFTHCDKIVFLMEIKRRRPQVAYPAAPKRSVRETEQIECRTKMTLNFTFLQFFAKKWQSWCEVVDTVVQGGLRRFVGGWSRSTASPCISDPRETCQSLPPSHSPVAT